MKKYLPLILVFVTIAILVIVLAMKKPASKITLTQNAEMLTYTNPEYGISFSYPKNWGEVTVIDGNSACPEEDTYRTPDTLSIYDKEFQFTDTDLPNTESFIRSGVRVYRMDPNKTNNCNDEVLQKLATKQITGEEFSSFQLTKANIFGFYGVHNKSASRLDTEGREQYTLFVKESETSVLVIQPYASFIPFFDSPEWKEIDSNYKMDIRSYIEKGQTAGPLRNHLGEFRKVAESIRLDA